MDATKRATSHALACTQTCIFVSKMFLTRKSIVKRPCRVLYTTLPMSVYYKKTLHLAVTYRDKTLFFDLDMFTIPKPTD